MLGIRRYIHRCGAFSVARFDRQGNAKAMIRGTGDRLGSTLFCINELNNVALGPVRLKMVIKTTNAI